MKSGCEVMTESCLGAASSELRHRPVGNTAGCNANIRAHLCSIKCGSLCTYTALESRLALKALRSETEGQRLPEFVISKINFFPAACVFGPHAACSKHLYVFEHQNSDVEKHHPAQSSRITSAVVHKVAEKHHCRAMTGRSLVNNAFQLVPCFHSTDGLSYYQSLIFDLSHQP